MLIVETIGRIRREHFVKGKTIKEIARHLRVSRNTVRRVLPGPGRPPSRTIGRCSRGRSWGGGQRSSRNCWRPMSASRRVSRLTLIRVYEALHGRGYAGGYDAVRRYARRWSQERGHALATAYVPLSFAPGEAYQFD